MRLFEQSLDKEGWKEYTLVTLLALFITISIAIKVDIMTYDHPDFPKVMDHHKYIEMAKGNPLNFHIAPFCWRIFVPSLAKIFPFSLQRNFFMIAFMGIFLTGITIYFVMKEFFSSRIYATIGIFTFFSLGWGLNCALYDFWLPDALSFLFMTLILYSILIRNDLLFVILLLIGVSVKESVLFIAPLYYTFNTRKFIDLRLFMKFVLLVFPSILVLIAVRLIIPAMNEDLVYLSTLNEKLKMVYKGMSSYNYRELFYSVGVNRFQNLSYKALKAYSVGTFGVFIMLTPFFAIKKNGLLFVKFLPFLIFVYAQLLFAVNTERLLIFAFPAMIILTLNGLKAISDRLCINPLLFISLPIVLWGLNMISDGNQAKMELQLLVYILFLAFTFQIGRVKKNNDLNIV
ncbi:MAG: hypothetical protein ACFFBP_23540 [Promethearchaeota archaeon]